MRKIVLVFAFMLLFSFAGSVSAADEFAPGLELHIENCPNQIYIGDTLSFQVRVINQSGQPVQCILRTYFYDYNDTLAYPPPVQSTTVFLHEGDQSTYDREVDIPVGEQTFSENIKIRSDLQLVSTTGSGRLRARLGVMENGVFVNIVPVGTNYITIFPAASPGVIVPVKLGVGVAVATALIMSVMNLRKLSGTSVRKPSRRSVRRRTRRSI